MRIFIHGQAGAELLFQVISKRYKAASAIITTNIAYARWPRSFAGDATLTSALLDRLLHHAETVVIEGESCFAPRPKKRRKAGTHRSAPAGLHFQAGRIHPLSRRPSEGAAFTDSEPVEEGFAQGFQSSEGRAVQLRAPFE